jgi:hypothetical protein
LPGKIKENSKTLQAGQSASQPRFDLKEGSYKKLHNKEII